MNSTVKQLLIWVLTLCCLLVGWRYVVTNMAPGHDKAISLTDLQNDADNNKISTLMVNGEDVTGTYKEPKDGNTTFHTTIPANYPDLYKDLRDHGVNVSIKDEKGNLWFSVLLNALPIIVLLALFMFMMRQMQSGGNKALSFGKNRARLLSDAAEEDHVQGRGGRRRGEGRAEGDHRVLCARRRSSSGWADGFRRAC